ncbi:MAG: glycoside hydrolase family 2 [Firmicutes bacterium]|nr:glycoside hydrolase family 2 [Bacillota bacterium]
MLINYLTNKLGLDINKYRPLVFFGINIDQDDDNIIEYVRWCKQQGFGGFNIIISGEFQGRANQAWMEKMLHAYEVAFRTAKEEGLEVWIFDDWGYPSGTAGGLVCTEPAYRLKRLKIALDCFVTKGDSVTVYVPEQYLAAGVITIDGSYQSLSLKAGEYFTYTGKTEEDRLVIVQWEYDPHQAKSAFKSFPGDPAMSIIDMLKPEATQRFIEVMHEMYYSRFKEYMGSTVKGFFYDEPYVAYAFPWTESLSEVFKKKKGYDLLSILPELMIKTYYARGEIAQYTDDFFEVWTDLAAEAYYGEMSRWCEERGLELSGHLDLDHHYNTMSTISGHFYKNLRYNHRPAIDVIWAQIAPNYYADFPRFAGSIKNLLGRERATSETFAGMGLGLSGDLMRFITDHQVIRGINDFHLMYSGNKPPAHERSPQMPHHMLQEPFGRLIYERMALASAIGSAGEAANHIALYLPALDFHRAQLGLRRTGIANAEALPWEWVRNIAEYLTYAPYTFDYIWQEALLELSVDVGGLRTKSGYLIDTIIIPPGTTMGEEVIAKLKAFHNQGGKVIAVFKPIWPLADQAVICNEVLDLENFLPKMVNIDTKGKISLAVRKGKERTVYLLLNEQNRYAQADLEFNTEGALYELSLVDQTLALLTTGAKLQVRTRFLSMELKVFVVEHQGDTSLGTTYQLGEVVTPINWSIKLPDGTNRALPGEQWPDWAELGFPGYSGDLYYTGEFIWDSQQEQAVIEVEQLYSHAIIYIDGQEVGKMPFRPYRIHVSDLTKGKHRIQVRVYNTPANEMCGTLELERELYKGRFAHLAHYDRGRIKSGLLEPIRIYPKNY